MVTLIGMLAFSIDIGYLAAAKSESSRTADAAALAACWEVFDSKQKGVNEANTRTNAMNVANQMAGLNPICNSSPSLSTSNQSSDIQIGYLASMASNTPLTQNSQSPFQAVRVSVKRTESSNGKIPFYFGRIFGNQGQELTATATAAMSTQIKGFQSPPAGTCEGLDILPFAIDQTTWNALQTAGSDSYKFNATTGQVSAGSDGIREVNLYPQGTGSPGNRGTVDIGGSNNSTNDIARQIVYGISSQDLAELGKPLSLGTSGTMTLNGDTGISAGVKDELASIIGKTRIIPVFSSVSGNGNNANYTIVKWVGIRVMAVKLTGPMNGKHVIVQPAPIIARNAIAGDSSRTWSESVFSPVVLVQ
jgi:hypothetical protein